MSNKYLADAGTVIAISKKLQQILSPHREILYGPNGFEPSIFHNKGFREGPIKFGWAGNAADPCKGLNDILKPASSGDFELHIAGGALTLEQMSDFYNSIDVICIASTAEGGPFTLLEAMACGCFPVSVNVGVVPELIKHRINGLIANRSVDAFRAAFQWCKFNIPFVRSAGAKNADEIIELRSWEKTISLRREAIRIALNNIGWYYNSQNRLAMEEYQSVTAPKIIHDVASPPQKIILDASSFTSVKASKSFKKIKLDLSDKVKKYMELQCNSDASLYYEPPAFKHMYPYFRDLNPVNVVELGAGIGRMSVYIKNVMHWDDTTFYFVDGSTGNKQICDLRYDKTNEFYNSWDATREFCVANGLTKLVLIDADIFDMPDNVRFDLCYSVLAIGFHWSLSLYLEKMKKFMKPDSFLMFQIRSNSASNPNRAAQFVEFNKSNLRYAEDTGYDIVEFDPQKELLVIKS